MRCPVCGVEVESNAPYHIGGSDKCRKELIRRFEESAGSPEALSHEPMNEEVTKR